MYDDHDSPDPYAGRTPWLRRPVVRGLITLVAVGSFLLVTLVSSCGPRRRSTPATTTTIPAVQVMAPPGPGVS